MTFGEFAEGLVFFAASVGSALFVAWLVTERVYGYLRGSARGVAFGTLATGVLIGIHLVPGALGLLSRWSVFAAATLAAAGAWLALRSRAAPRRAAPRGFESQSGRVSWLLALGAAGLLALWSAAAFYDQWGIASTGIDTLTHHLPNIALWIQTGTFWRVDQFAPFLANGNYPQHGDVVFLAAVLPWENDAFVRPLNWPFVVLLGVAVYAIAAELRAPRAAGVAFAAALCAIPVVIRTATSGAMTDVIMLAALATAVLFLLRHLREQRAPDLVMAGLALGIAIGTKWYGVSSGVVVGGAWIAAALLVARRRPGRGGTRRVARQSLVLAGLSLASGGFWLLRNWVESGNPVYPARVELLGARIFDAPPDPVRDKFGFTISDYLTDWGVLADEIVPEWARALDLPALAIIVGAAAAALVAARAIHAGRRRGRPAPAWTALGLATGALLLAIAYTITPDTALGRPGRPELVGPNSRYVLPALLVAASLAAWAAGRIGRARHLLEALAFAGVVMGIRRGFFLDRELVARALVAVALLGGVGWALGRAVRGAHGRRRAAAAALAALAAVALVVAVAHERQQHFNEGRYGATGDAALDWITANARTGRRIALVGHWDTSAVSPVWPSFGPRLGNEVEYAGPTVDGQLRDYPDARAFGRRLEYGDFDLLLAGRGAPPRADTEGDRWARELGLQPVARGRFATLYRVP